MLSTTLTFQDDIDFLKNATDTITIDTETTGLDIHTTDRMVGISVYADGRSFYFAFRHLNPAVGHDNYAFYESNLPESYIREVIAMLNSHSTHTYFNATFDLHVLLREGMERPAIIEDVMVAAHLMNENEPSFALKNLADKYIDPQSSNADVQLKSLLKSRGWNKGNISYLNPNDVTVYAEDDVILTRKLKDFYLPFIERYKLMDLWKLDNEFRHVLNRIEQRGLLVDKELCWQYLQECDTRAAEYKFAVQEIISSHLLNPNSSKQVQGILRVEKANRKVLQRLIEDDSIPPVYRYIAKNILMYRIWTKADTTYYLPYLQKIDSNNVLHPNFNSAGPVSARLSSSNPNMTAVPRESDEYKVKDVFIARPGYILLDFDLSQAEMRIASYYANEKRMINLLNAGEDIHQDAADAMHVSRHIGKTLNFAVIYRAGVTALIKLLGINEDEAREYLRSYHQTYPGFSQSAVYYGEMVKHQNYVTLFSGRMRRFFKYENGKYIVDPMGPHKAFNSIIQGTVADIMRISMRRIDRELRESMDVHMLLQVHDSILFEVPEETWRICALAIQRIMEDFKFNPRITTEGREKDGRIVIGKVGARWGKMSKIWKDEIYSLPTTRMLTA